MDTGVDTGMNTASGGSALERQQEQRADCASERDNFENRLRHSSDPAESGRASSAESS